MANTPVFSPNTPKDQVLSAVQAWIEQEGFHVTEANFAKPWGGYLALDDSQIESFAQKFFPDIASEVLTQKDQGLHPKVLIVAPHARLSWQYHHRRSEEWRVEGEQPVGVVTSQTDELPDSVRSVPPGEHVSIGLGERHRLQGLDSWGIVMEIWKHADPANPSNEEDIVRVADDYQRH